MSKYKAILYIPYDFSELNSGSKVRPYNMMKAFENDNDLDVDDASDLTDATKVYLSWLVSWTGYALKNVDNLTEDAISMNWSLNKTKTMKIPEEKSNA